MMVALLSPQEAYALKAVRDRAKRERETWLRIRKSFAYVKKATSHINAGGRAKFKIDKDCADIVKAYFKKRGFSVSVDGYCDNLYLSASFFYITIG